VSLDALKNGPIRSVCITGGTSFLGGTLIKKLLDRGWRVSVIVRAGSDVTRLAPFNGRIVTISADNSTEKIAAAFQQNRVDAVVHLATRYLKDHGPGDIQGLVEGNILYGTRVLEAMKLSGARHFVYSGSYFEYGQGGEFRPINLYASLKRAFDSVIEYFVQHTDVQWTKLVLYETYGVGDPRKKLLNVIASRIARGEPLDLGSPGTVMNFVHIEDVAEAFVRVLEEPVYGGPFSVKDEMNVRLDELIGIIEEICGQPLDCRWEAFKTAANFDQEPWSGQAIKGWSPRNDFRVGLRELLRASGAVKGS